MPANTGIRTDNLGKSPVSDRLESWKEIAAYLKRDVRTVQRWEITERLPVHRHEHKGGDTVYAFVVEVEAWRRTRDSNPTPIAVEPVRTGSNLQLRKLMHPWAWAALAGVVLVVFTAWMAPWKGSPIPALNISGSLQITDDGHQKFGPQVTDGSRLYFSEMIGSRLVLSEVSITGGETAHIPTPFANPNLYDMAPDHSGLLVGGYTTTDQAEAPLWVVPLPAGAPRRIGEVLAHGAAWSPNGEQIAFTNGSDLYIAKSDGTQPRKIATVSGSPLRPRFAPSGDRLRFTVFNKSSYSIWEVQADGTGLRPLWKVTKPTTDERDGAWTPDSNYFVYQAKTNNRWEVWVLPEPQGLLRRNSQAPMRLSTGPIAFYAPLPSADGNKLFAVGQQRRSELVRYDAKSKQFVSYLSGITAGQLDASKDGQWVAYVMYPENTLWRSKVDGTERIQLTHRPMQVGTPHWSPDGQQIAFMAAQPGKSWNVFLVSAFGGDPRQLMPPTEQGQGDPSWSPQGTSIMFGDEPGSRKPVAIHLLDLSTRVVTKLPESEGLFAPRWSPNGRYVVALSADQTRLMLFDFTTRKWQQLSTNVASFLSWSADSKFVYFDRVLTPDPAIYRISIPNGRVQSVVDLTNFKMAHWDLMGFWSGLAADGSPLTQRDTSTQEIYAFNWQLP